MFGTKNAGLMETVLRIRSRDAKKAPRVREKAEDPVAKTPAELLVRKETYFAMIRSSRWNQ